MIEVFRIQKKKIKNRIEQLNFFARGTKIYTSIHEVKDYTQ